MFVPLDLAVAALDPTRGWGESTWTEFVAATGLLAFGSAISYAAVIEMLRRIAAGEATSVRLSLSRALYLLPTLLTITVVACVTVLAGLVALVLPGILLFVWWFLVFQVAVIENRGWYDSLRRSRELASGHFWRLLALAVVICGAFVVGDYALWRTGSALLPDTLGAWLGGAIADTTLTGVSAAVATVAYWRLSSQRLTQDVAS